jgi:hypothetical protein
MKLGLAVSVVLVGVAGVGCVGALSGGTDDGGGTVLPDGGSATDAGGRPDAGQTVVDAGILSGPLPVTLATSVTAEGLHDAPGDVTIAPGATLTLAAGATITFAPGARLIVQGGLVASGVAGNEVTLSPESGQGAWGGILVEQGGTTQMAFVQLMGAGTGAGQAALAVGSTAGSVTLTDSTISSSRPALLFNANADIERVVVHNASPAIDGPVFVAAGNPTLTDIRIDQGTTGVDAIVVNGGGPQISHLTVRDHHCCIHANDSDGMSVNAMDCDTSDVYGFMYYSSISATGSGNNITCTDSAYAYVGNNPIDLENNYWGGGAPGVGGGEAGLIDGTNYATQPFDAGMR